MKQKTAAIKFLRTKIAAGYVLILILIFSIVYIWFKEHHKLEEMKEASHKISCLRQNIHDIYVRAVDLSLIGETILNWDDEDIELYHTKRLEVDTLLYQFSSVYPSECIDSICLLLAEKEKLLYGIMQVLNEQEEIEEKIAKQVPVIARKSTREKPQKRKRTGFLGLFGKKEEAKPTATTTISYDHNAQYTEQRHNSPSESTECKVREIHRQSFGKKHGTEQPVAGND